MDINRNGTDGNPAPPVDCSKDTASQNRPVEFPPEMQDLNLAVRNVRQPQTEGLPTLVRWWECRGNAKELLETEADWGLDNYEKHDSDLHSLLQRTSWGKWRNSAAAGDYVAVMFHCLLADFDGYSKVS